MAVPSYQKFKYPFLAQLEDGRECTLQQMYQSLGDYFNLTEEDREKMLSGNQRVLHNRIGWAKTYLKKAGLITTVRRGTFKITDEGKRVLSDTSITTIEMLFY